MREDFVVGLGVLTLFWDDFEGKSMTIKLFVHHLNENRVIFDQGLQFWLQFVIWVWNDLNVESMWVPGVGGVCALSVESMNFSWSINLSIDFD